MAKRGLKWPYVKSLRLDTYKLFLSLAVVILFCALVWTGIKLFSHQLRPLFGSLLFLGELVLLIWSSHVLQKNARRSPSFKLVILALVVISVVFAFAGVPPFDSIRNAITGYIAGFGDENGGNVSEGGNGVIVIPEPSPEHLKFMESAVMKAINAERERRGITILSPEDSLVYYAREHSQDMANNKVEYSSHIEEDFILVYWESAPFETPEPPIEVIMNNYEVITQNGNVLLYPNFNHIGVGIATKDNIAYTTCFFWKKEMGETDRRNILGVPTIPQE